ncbi:uncharacterized protein Z520_02441 [Fonsecaea multimorphosa CBS 102226]|uniref:Short-chain dehydrogenase/reductase 3 n=1 Tax=Fonsecaea multimorphosa CBS 102226 TaxID=1442371 RepID=A0A0D2K896_9EURO|nr:uncharacterized protein Z520_02441 [Fonsecaea multimorphosa CBS 102226]KIY02303.1 hypothetical protein Z520_02441 [Fonsecaea multimorphosa CBS 102226]OAL28950.1 hypothetical protein AYO22_02386 [Fonsecaea multimorphosa]
MVSIFKATALEPLVTGTLLYSLPRLPPSLLERLPQSLHSVVQSPRTATALTFLFILGILRKANNFLSRRAINNWTRTDRWDASKELVLVTGGASGIGEKVTAGLAARGVKVVILDVNAPKTPLPPNVAFFQVNITSSDAVRDVANEIRKTYGHPTVLVNNAGVGEGGTILSGSEASIRRTFDVNTICHFVLVKEFLPEMVRNNHGHVVTVASMASFATAGNMIAYACSKASALAFHEGLGQELRYWYNAPKVRTSIVHPSWVATPMTQPLQDADEGFRRSAMRVETVADAIVKQIISGSSGQIILPASLSNAALIRALPFWIQEAVRGDVTKMLKRTGA